MMYNMLLGNRSAQMLFDIIVEALIQEEHDGEQISVHSFPNGIHLKRTRHARTTARPYGCSHTRAMTRWVFSA